MEDLTQIEELLRTNEEDSKWISEKYDELRRKYEGKVFVVRNKNVIEHAESIEELLDKLEKKNENAAFLLIETIPRRDLSLIL
jgi:2-polyprenyl-3-methyl-5-hydroxy-6-metoxy-1,4-benzoquinol methylase